jgi:hypothetical protein
LLALLLLPCAAHPAAPPRRDEAPRALIRRAIRAAGLEVAGERYAVRRKFKMQSGSLGPSIKVEATGVLSQQAGGEVGRVDLDMKFPGLTNNKMVIVSNGKKSWRSYGTQVQDLTEAELKENTRQAHQERVAALVGLLTDRRFTFTPLGESKVDRRPALGVKVSCKDRPDVSLYFDRRSGLLVKHAARMAALPGGALNEVVLRDYAVGAQAEERTLQAAGVKTTGPALLAYLKKQVRAGDRRARAARLVKDLGDDDFDVREQAEKDLIELGPAALPALRAALKSKDLEVVKRAERCIKEIGPERVNRAAGAAVRLLALRRPAGSVAVLLDLLPGADEALERDVYAVLCALARRGDKPHPQLLKALQDKDPARREVARAVLGKDGGAYLKKPGRRVFLPGRLEARTQVLFVNGKENGTLRFEASEYFNRLDDKLFARP